MTALTIQDVSRRSDADAETEANLHVQDMIPRLKEVLR